MMGAVDDAVKGAELVRSVASRRLAVDLPLALGLLAGATTVLEPHVPWRAAIKAVPGLASGAFVTVAALALFGACFSVVHLATWRIERLGRRVVARRRLRRINGARAAARKREAEAQAEAARAAAEKAEAERVAWVAHQRAVLPHMPAACHVALEQLLAATDHSAARSAKAYDVTKQLTQHRFIQAPVDLGGDLTLHRLRADAVPVVREFFAKREAEEREARVEKMREALTETGPGGRELLELFLDAAPDDPEERHHGYVQPPGYHALLPLTRAGVLKQVHAKRRGERDTLGVNPEAVPLVEETLGRKLRRTSLLLSNDRLLTGADSGAGVTSTAATPIRYPVQYESLRSVYDR